MNHSINNIPLELKVIIEPETVDFICKSKRNKPLRSSFFTIIFGLAWLGFTSIFFFAFFGPLLKNEEVNFTSNDIPVTASMDNLEPLLLPAIVIGVFILLGIGMFVWGVAQFFQKGSYFVGTPTRFIQFRKGIATTTDWEQFSGNIQIRNKPTLGSIELQLRTGKMQHRKNQTDKYIPDVIYMTEIENVLAIEKKCRIRIKENDPTPASVS
tara:strand:- start:168579 stop:169211 length:633 start_codon:yes stop_codon:yes gene_type:complete